MSHCVPIKDLKDMTAFSQFVKKSNHPIFVTKDGRDEFVVMSSKVYESQSCVEQKEVQQDSAQFRAFCDMIEQSENDFSEGRYKEAHAFLEGVRNEYAH